MFENIERDALSQTITDGRKSFGASQCNLFVNNFLNTEVLLQLISFSWDRWNVTNHARNKEKWMTSDDMLLTLVGRKGPCFPILRWSFPSLRVDPLFQKKKGSTK